MLVVCSRCLMAFTGVFCLPLLKGKRNVLC